MNKQLIDILKAVTVSSKDDGKKWTDVTRLAVIKEMLDCSGYELLNAGSLHNDLYLLYGKGKLSKSKKYTVISSHIDTVMSRFFVDIKGSKLTGTFDNAITNAAAIYNMLNGKFDDNILVAFTGNEECGMQGANNLCKYLSDYDITAYMVVDVSWEIYYSNAFTIENIKLTTEQLDKLLSASKAIGEKFLFVNTFEYDDETAAYSDYSCFCYCIPIDNDDEMHTNVGVDTTVELFEKYTDAMPLIAKAIAIKN
ncbi:MAG: M28 family peptidase [Prevotellaceae bacterium]|nr:M28 family peptidase [Prevotellaceae bacterium]